MSLHVKTYGNPTHPTLVCLHGFTGAQTTWEPLLETWQHYFHCVFVDLPGHGRSQIEDASAYRMESVVEQLNETLSFITEPFFLLGYSMGGRTALSYTVAYPERVRHLVLESASPGLATKEEQEERKVRDEQLARRIEREGIASFVAFWEEIPLFETQRTLPSDVRQAVREERLQQTVSGLTNSLRGMGTGAQPSMWPHLVELTQPVTLVTGSLDPKFIRLAEQMKRQLPNAVHVTISGAGHAIHVEKPLEFATIVKEQLI